MPHISNPDVKESVKTVVVEKPVYQTRIKTVTEYKYITRTVPNKINRILVCVAILSLLSHLF